MAQCFDTLGSRILQTARMAVAMHLTTVAESRSSSSSRGQRVVIGRAGPQVAPTDSDATDLSTDGSIVPAGGDRRTGHRRLDFGGQFDSHPEGAD